MTEPQTEPTPCRFGPLHEPFYCRIHGDVRLTLDAERCRTAVRVASHSEDCAESRNATLDEVVRAVEALPPAWATDEHYRVVHGVTRDAVLDAVMALRS